MTEFLILLLMQVTIFSSITALIIIAVKQIFKCRIPPRLGMIMWIVLLARLICPIFPESRVSIYNFIPVGREIMYSLTNDVGDEIIEREEKKTQAENPYVIVSTDKSESYEEAEVDTDARENTGAYKNSDSPVTIGEYIINDAGEEADQKAAMLNSVILIVYISGIVICLCVSIFAYRHAKKRALSKSFLCDDEKILDVYLKISRRLGIKEDKLPPLRTGMTSMLAGCISPAVIYRDGMDEKEASFVLAHELSHYRYGDNPILLISTFVACFFWYNPLIWIVRKILREDVEVLCDSRTIEYFNLSSTEYAKIICRNSIFNERSANSAIEAGCHMSATGRSLKNRLRTISHNKNKKFLPKAASGFMCVVIIAICLTNPIISQNSDFSEYIENFSEVSGIDERVLQLESNTTVSTYLGNISLLLEEKFAPEYKRKIGNGSLEKFKRIVSELDYIDSGTASEVQRLITDEVLTNKSCALINDCVAAILAEGEFGGKTLTLLPEYITVADMESILSNLTEAEGEAVMKWYNKGVSGAKVEFDRCYTPAMMELILERI
ncbi:MAG: M56 family metallopeptidase, partial [Eubacteriales bacterium]